MGGFAWVTLATNDSYSLGALVLAHSLKQTGTAHQLAVLVSPGVTNVMRQKLASVFNVVQEVNILDSKDEANLRLLKRPELGVTFTKLHCWRLTQFDKCVFLDADTLVLKNCDDLFGYEEFSAAPDVGWPDCFNSGVFVFRPSNETYEKLVAFAIEKGSFDGGDQGLLNLYFSGWAHKDISKHLPFIYNMCSTACYSYLPAFKQFGINVRIVHFIGSSKPWLQYFNSETKQVEPSGDLQHLRSVLQCWWNIFCAQIHPNLSTEMIWSGSSTESSHLVVNPNTSEPHNFSKELTVSDQSVTHYKDDWDPWEEYDNNKIEPQSEPPPSQINNAKSEIFKSHNTNSQSSNVPQHIPPPITQTLQTPNIPTTTLSFTSQLTTSLPSTSHVSQLNSPLVTSQIPFIPPVLSHVPEPIIPSVPTPTTMCSSHSYNTTDSIQSNTHDTINHNTPSKQDHTHVINCTPTEILVHNTSKTRRDPDPELPLECEASTVTKDCLSHSKDNDEVPDNGGLAGAFAQLTLGSPRSPAQNALEDHLRRQGWEVGHIDYLGRDSFDNIWSKICETLSSGPPPQAKETPAQEVTEPQPKLETAEISPAPIESEATQTTPIDATKVEQPTKTPEEQTVSEPKCDTSVPVDSAKPVEVSAEVPKTPEASSQKIEEPSKPLDVKIESETTIIDQTKSPIKETPKPIETSKLAEEPKATESKPLEEIPILAQEALPVAICKLAGVEVPKPAEAPKSTETSPKTPEETVKAIEEITKLCEKASEVAATVLDGGLKITEQVPIVAQDVLKLAEQAPNVAETCPLAEAPKTTEEKITEEPSKKAEEVPKAAEEVTKAADEVTKPAEEVTKAAEEVTKAAEKVIKAAEEIPKATEDLGSKVEAVKPVEEALKTTEVLKDIAGIIKPIEEIQKLTPEVPKAAEEVIQQIVAPKPEELVTQDIPKTLEEMLKIDAQVVPKAEIAQTEVSDVIPVSVDEIKPTDTAKGGEALAKSPEKEEAKSKGKKGSKGEGKGHKHIKEAPKPPTKPTEPIKSKTPPKTDGDKEVKKLSEKDSESTIPETPKTEAQPKCEKKAKDAVKPPQEEKEKEIPSEAPKSEEKAVKPQEEAKTETAEKSKKSKQPNKSPKPTEAASEGKAELTEVPKVGETKKDAKKCKKCPMKKDCSKEECKECPEKSCAKEPAKEEPTPDVPKTPEVIEATPPTTPAAEKPLEEKALSAETVVPVTPPPTSAGAAAPTPPPRKSSSGNKKSKAKK